MFTGKRPSHFRHFRLDEAAETGVLDQPGRTPQSFAQATPNELKLGKGGKVVRAGHRLGGGVGG